MDDEPDCPSWPAWKFGMKRDDLHTKLQDQYNSVTLSIQDPEAFRADVCDISRLASTCDEFHQLLAERKEQRLRELNETLQSASCEIVANPNLIGTEQWQFAIQLFRTRSFDSLVRYFSSYIPDDHPWHRSETDTTYKSFFEESEDDEIVITNEPSPIAPGVMSIPASHLPPSPRSMTMCSDSSKASTPSRSLSFSEPEIDVMVLSGTLSCDYDEDFSQPDDLDTPTTSISDISEHPMSKCWLKDHDYEPVVIDDDARDKYDGGDEENENSEIHPTCPRKVDEEEDTYESETPTPRVEIPSVSSMRLASDTEKSTASSPSKYDSLQRSFRDASPGLSRSRRRSPEIGRIQKPSPTDSVRARPKARRRHGG